jgi:queuine tRNA-ribosyltransferase
VSLDCEVVESRSGAAAMRDRATGELMHPLVGPALEAQRLYVQPSRLQARLRERDVADGSALRPLVLLDVGLGAASNSIAAWQLSEAAPAHARRLEIVSFDRSVAALALALAPEHCAAFGLAGRAGQAARALIEAQRHHSDRTCWRLQLGELPGSLEREPAGSADVVFWDPFSLRANPELWTCAAFARLRGLCRDGATVHTYSGATGVRSALLLAGFAVGIGEPVSRGKYGTCAALRVEDLVTPLDARWLQRLTRSSAPLPADAPRDALARIAAMPQFAGGSVL